MWQKAISAVSGGGKSFHDANFTIGTETKRFDLGFKPKYIVFVFTQANYSNSGYVYEFDEDVSPNTWAYTQNNSSWTYNNSMSTSGYTVSIVDLDSTGFSIYNSGGGGTLTIHSIFAVG